MLNLNQKSMLEITANDYRIPNLNRKNIQITTPHVWLTVVLLWMLTQSAWAQNYTPNRQEFVGPFPSWINVKTKYGAKGDGSSDDTQALQRAFDELGKGGENDLKVLYLPAGTYRISAGLKMAAKKHISIIGEDPATTKIKWAGSSGGIMFTLNGVAYSRFSRITWDGSKTAHTAVAHFWDGSTGFAVTHNEHSDEHFIDVGHGLRAGKPHTMDAETAVLRCRFIRNSIAGVSIESFNALDWYIWDSYFEDCKVGVTNNPPTGGAGNFYVFHSIFKRSTHADVHIKNTNFFALRDNYSIGSRMFLVSDFIGNNGGPFTIQKNTVLDYTDPSAVYIGSKGPFTFIDNVFRSKDGQSEPVIRAWTGDITTIGNTFTVNNAVYTTEKWITVDDVLQSRSTINVAEPLLQATPVKRKRRIFELPTGWDTGRIQKTIDSAAALAGQRPVVHMRPGAYELTKTIIIPSGADLQLIGDGFDSRLSWRGTAGEDALRLEGADKLTLEDFAINGNYNARANGLVIKHSDQAGKQIFMEGVSVGSNSEGGVLMEGFRYTKAELHDFNHAGNSATSVKASGGTMHIFGGSSSNNVYSYDVTDGGKLMVQDIWYESNRSTGNKTFINLQGSGTFTLNGAKVYCSSTPDVSVAVDNFNGKATFLGLMMNGKFVVKGDGRNTSALAMGHQFNTLNAYSNTSANAKAAMLNSRVYDSGSKPLANIGNVDATFIRQMLEQVRKNRPEYKSATGLVLHRLKVGQAKMGIRMMPATATTAPIANQQPAVNITAPANNASFTAPASMTISATATDADGTVAKVEFFQGTTKLGEDLSAPYSFTWNNVGAGTYSITAKATDSKGESTTSAPVSVNVSTSSTATIAVASFTLINADTKQPIAGFDPIPNNATIDLQKLPTKNLNIRVNTKPSTVGSVRFAYNGNAIYATENIAPYELAGDKSWSPATGSHSLKATPFSASNATGTSGTPLSLSFSVISSSVTGSPTSSTCSATGSILREYWANITGTSVTNIPLNTNPTSRTQLTSFEAPTNIAENYGQRIRGYICPPASGNYTFWIAGDDNSELYLSTDDNPANKRRIASVPGSTGARIWNKYSSQQSSVIALQAGKRYYIEALQKEGVGGDNLAVGWQLPNGTLERPIQGSRLSPFSTSTARVASDAPINEFNNLSMEVYPNPSLGEKIEIQVHGLESEEEVIVSIHNSTGGLVATQVYKAYSDGGLQKELDFPAKLPSGMYSIVMRGKKQQISKKVIITN